MASVGRSKANRSALALGSLASQRQNISAFCSGLKRCQKHNGTNTVVVFQCLFVNLQSFYLWKIKRPPSLSLDCCCVNVQWPRTTGFVTDLSWAEGSRQEPKEWLGDEPDTRYIYIYISRYGLQNVKTCEFQVMFQVWLERPDTMFGLQKRRWDHPLFGMDRWRFFWSGSYRVRMVCVGHSPSIPRSSRFQLLTFRSQKQQTTSTFWGQYYQRRIRQLFRTRSQFLVSNNTIEVLTTIHLMNFGCAINLLGVSGLFPALFLFSPEEGNWNSRDPWDLKNIGWCCPLTETRMWITDHDPLKWKEI